LKRIGLEADAAGWGSRRCCRLGRARPATDEAGPMTIAAGVSGSISSIPADARRRARRGAEHAGGVQARPRRLSRLPGSPGLRAGCDRQAEIGAYLREPVGSGLAPASRARGSPRSASCSGSWSPKA
jgi:hypothetical protein